MKQKNKKIIALMLGCILQITVLFGQTQISVFATDAASVTDAEPAGETEQSFSYQEDAPIYYDLPGDQFTVVPTGSLIKDILQGSGTYFSEIHNLYTCTGPGGNRLAAYCMDPARPSPTSSTTYLEYAGGNQTDFATGNKASASAVFMYGYGGESSINNEIVGMAESNPNVGGSYGLYVINGTGQFGLLINGVFYQLNALEAQAVTAAAIHKLNGSDIQSIHTTFGGNVENASRALWDLYTFGNWTKKHIDEYGYAATYHVIDAATTPTRSISVKLKTPDGNLIELPADKDDENFNWAPYCMDGVIYFEVIYTADKCESKLLASAGTKSENNLTYTHETETTFPWMEFANGYYDYFKITPNEENTAPVSVLYHGLESCTVPVKHLGYVDVTTGGFEQITGTQFTQHATIAVKYSDLLDGKIMDLSFYIPSAHSYTSFYGDGDGVDGYYNAGRFFAASGYQDMAVCSPNEQLSSFTGGLSVRQHPIKRAFQLMKYGQDMAASNYPLAHAGFMACNVNDLNNEDGTYIFDFSKAIPLCPDGSTELFTDQSGYAISIPIPPGTYLVRETTVPNEYYPVDDFLIDISGETKDPLPIQYLTDQKFSAYVQIEKRDANTHHPITSSPATFKIWSYEQNEYLSFISDEGTPYCELVTDESGICKTPSPLSPGTYRIDEVKPPAGYYLSEDDSSIDFTISKTVSHETYYENGTPTQIGIFTYTMENTPLYGTVELTKTGEDRVWAEETSSFTQTELPLEAVFFDIIADEDIVSSDNHNTILYKAGSTIETIVTNESGYACSTIPLPIGIYRLHERTPSGYEPVDDIHFTISENDTIVEKKTDFLTEKTILKTFQIHNTLKQPSIQTAAYDKATNTQDGTITEEAIVIDQIHYENLIPGTTYLMEGSIFDKTNHTLLTSNGVPITSQTEFTCQSEVGDVQVLFTFDSSDLSGKEIVLFEKLYVDDKLICIHEDIDNQSQTISYPEIPTINEPPEMPLTTEDIYTTEDVITTEEIPTTETPSTTEVPEPSIVPKTGDSSPILFIIFFLIISCGSIYYIQKRFKK